mmetsp:Transcript_8406/g.20628  ORF Transcript_8406/g.20628 Transcript_8406/m.20628 type:complete len:249 (-) Transcript_8406:475-1221(-)
MSSRCTPKAFLLSRSCSFTCDSSCTAADFWLSAFASSSLVLLSSSCTSSGAGPAISGPCTSSLSRAAAAVFSVSFPCAPVSAPQCPPAAPAEPSETDWRSLLFSSSKPSILAKKLASSLTLSTPLDRRTSPAPLDRRSSSAPLGTRGASGSGPVLFSLWRPAEAQFAKLLAVEDEGRDLPFARVSLFCAAPIRAAPTLNILSSDSSPECTIRVKPIVVPFPTSESMLTSPPCPYTNCCTSDSPSPVPS